MPKNASGRGISILLKTSLVSGLITLLLLAVNSYISIQIEAWLTEEMIEVYAANQKTALKKESSRIKDSLVGNMEVNLEICTSVTRSFLYNFDREQLYKLLSNYLKLDGILAIKVLDADGNPFGAAWKNPDITTGEALPGEVPVKEDFSVAKDALQEGMKMGSVKIYYTDSLIQENILKREENTRENIQAFKNMASNSINTSITIQVIVALAITLALILTLVMCLHLFVTRPIKNTIVMIKDIAQGEGDLTRRLAAKSMDEIGELSYWFNQFVENLQVLIGEISENAVTIGKASTEFSTLSDTMDKGVNNLSGRSVNLARSADDMSSNMTSVAAAMGEASSNINMMASASEEMSSTISEIAQSAEKARTITNEAVSQTGQASEQVSELGKAAKMIGKVLETITDISEQVNLLALNATIEAARAGEAGKGFAVVANEIKALANQTAEASAAIKEQILGIQSSSGKTADVIGNMSQVVAKINDIVATIAAAVEEQSATTREISENISQASSGIMEVNENVSQGSAASQEIAREIAEVNESATGLASSSTDVKSNAGKLSELGNHLASLMAKFKV